MLCAENIVVQFGGVRALDGCTLQVAPSETVGLVGPNGSGKTTFLDVLSGFVTPAAGRITFHGAVLSGIAPYRRARLGIARAFQIPRAFDDLTCLENLEVAQASAPSTGGFSLLPEGALRLTGLSEYRAVYPRFLSFGQKRLLDLARALCSRPEMLLLDEPSAGVNPVLISKIIEVLKESKSRGLTMIVVEHNMEFIRAVCDSAAVLVDGKVLRYGAPGDVLTDPAVIAAYFGKSLEPTKRSSK